MANEKTQKKEVKAKEPKEKSPTRADEVAELSAKKNYTIKEMAEKLQIQENNVRSIVAKSGGRLGLVHVDGNERKVIKVL